MQYDAASCQLHAPQSSNSSPEIASPDTTSTPSFERAYEYSDDAGGGLPVIAARQWASTTPCRDARDGYSWMQAVHWVAGSGIHQASRGPQMGETTIRIAQLCADLNPCRPSVSYLMRRTGLSERTVQYHLAILRNMGLLAYTIRGGRRRGESALASEFVRVIPPVFDAALGIQTTGDGISRRPVRIAEENRGTIAKLAKKAMRKVRRKQSRKARVAKGRCTPIEGGYSSGSSAGGLSFPFEKNVASGERQSPTPKKPKRATRTLNKVGRRRQLGSELVAHVPWLKNSNPARVSWVARHVADAGWTLQEVLAWLENADAPKMVLRGPGFLAGRLKGATTIWPDSAARERAVEAVRDSRRAEKARHAEAAWDSEWTGPSNATVQRLVDDSLEAMWAAPAASEEVEDTSSETPLEIEDLTRDEVLDLRAAATKNPELIRLALELMGERDTRRLYTNRRVDEVIYSSGFTTNIRLHV